MWFAVDYFIEHFQYSVGLGLGIDLGCSVQSAVFSWFIKIADGELTGPRVYQSATRLTASWFVGELCDWCVRRNQSLSSISTYAMLTQCSHNWHL